MDYALPLKTRSRLHYVPLGLFFFFPFAFLLCYFIALSLGHINAFFAFISDAGTLPPEQLVFAQLVNMGAALFAYFVYIRYKQVEAYFRIRFARPVVIVNVIAMALGFITALGMSLVGNFPELLAKEVHVLGAFLAFVGGCIYIVFQGYFTFKMLPYFQTKFVAYLRTFLGILGVMLYFGAQTTLIMAFQRLEDKGKHVVGEEALKWHKEEKGYHFRAASVVMEWLLIAIFDAFIITFVSEFKKFEMNEPEIKFCSDVTSKVEEEDGILDNQEEFDAGDRVKVIDALSSISADTSDYI